MRNLVIFLALLLISCHNKSTSNYYTFETLNETLLASNKAIKSSTEIITKSFEDKLTEPYNKAKSEIWYPKMVKTHQLNRSVYDFIDSLKADILNKAGFKKEGNKERFEKDNKSAVRKIIKQQGAQLYGKLVFLKDSLFAIDKIIQSEFDTTLYILPPPYDKNQSMQQQFFRDFFDDVPEIAALAVLTKFQNSVCVAENKITAFIHSQIAYHPIEFWPEPIITQSSSILRKGEELKIIAGVGQFMVNNKMEVTINGKTIPLSEIGVAEYSFKTSSAAGTYKIPIKMTYSDQDANMRVIERIITYKVK